MHRILVVEDEKEITRILAKYLEREGYAYDICHDGFCALELFGENNYSLVILDIMMDGIDGLEVLRRIRSISNVPVLMTTARVQEADRLKGFEYGSDDYIVKPYSMKELMSRIRVFIGRVYGNSDNLKIGDLKIDFDQKDGYIKGVKINLSRIEYGILETLMKKPDRVFSREQLIEAVLGFDATIDNRSIDTYVKRVRKKIEMDPKNPKYLMTKYGIGYYFAGDPDENEKN